jgi:lysophospholipase L1-like esterase
MHPPSLPSSKYWIVLLAACMAFVAASAQGSHPSDATFTALEGVRDSVMASTSSAIETVDTTVRSMQGEGASKVPERWKDEFKAFAAAEHGHAPSAGGIVVTGSSSIARWDELDATRPSRNVVRRGLGGARMTDCVDLVDRLVLAYRPSGVVLYAGENDLAEGASPEQVLAAFVQFATRVHEALPQARIVVLSIKPSPSRRDLLPLVRRANALIEGYAETRDHLQFVNIYTPMLDAEGQPRADLFGADGLHMNAAGYAVWRKALERHLG